AISTPGDERSVFIAGDGKTVYFASDGYKGFGGLDVFKTTLNDDGTCGEVINIGEPFNTAKDDYGFITTASGNESYFVREGDIYFANTSEADSDLKPNVTVIISGTVKRENGDPVQMYLELEDGQSKEKISTSKSNSASGEFLFSTADVIGDYRIRDANHEIVDTSFTLKLIDGVAEYHVDIIIKDKPEAVTTTSGNKSILVNFEHDRDILDAEDRKQLDEIIEITHTSITFEISIIGHTDSHGSSEYNEKLGFERATSMKEYLIKNGVDKAKIIIKSMGESKLLEEDNKHRAAAERNRRAELDITYTY
ncbi:MAG: outer membrane protein OmpA-like peptidoglycan-associated protein, partial [Arenicella sp.]